MKRIHQNTYHYLILGSSAFAIALGMLDSSLPIILLRFALFYTAAFAVGGLFIASSSSVTWLHYLMFPFLLLTATGIIFNYRVWQYGETLTYIGVSGCTLLYLLDMVIFNKERITKKNSGSYHSW